MVSFFNTGDWFKESGVKPVEKFVPPYRYYCLLNMVFWSILILVPFFYLAFNIFTSGNLLHILFLVIPLGLRKFNIQTNIIYYYRKLENTFIGKCNPKSFIYSSCNIIQIDERFWNRQDIFTIRYRETKNEININLSSKEQMFREVLN